jgi:hypothetical protein
MTKHSANRKQTPRTLRAVSRPFLAVIAASYQEWYGQRLVKVSEILGTEEAEGILRRAAALLRMTKDPAHVTAGKMQALRLKCRRFG